MKMLFLGCMLASLQAFSAPLDYKCIMRTLQDYDSINYSTLTEAYVDEMLSDAKNIGHYDATLAAKKCLAESGQSANYQDGTALPVALQDIVAQAVYQKYSCVDKLTEVTTTSELIAHGEKNEIIYTTIFRSVAFSHPARFTVKSSATVVGGFESFNVLSVDSLYGDNICP